MAALAAAFFVLATTPLRAQTEIVLHTKNASAVIGDWQLVSDTSAATGTRVSNPDRGAAKQADAVASPLDYFELTFTAEAGKPYRLWVRSKADNDHWANDSVFVQFSGAVYASGGAAYRIGTTDAASVSLEECTGCGSYRWGWNDSGWDGLGPVIYFGTTGPQTIRFQRREDGVSIDQVVLSASKYLSASPGTFKNDSTLLEATTSGSTSTSSTSTDSSTTTSAGDILIPVASSATLRGDWHRTSDSTAATGTAVWNPDRGAAKLTSALASPADYVDVTFNAEAARAYRLWIRGRAHSDHWTNDSVFVQFSGSLSSAGSAVYRIGTTSATVVSIEQGSGQGLSGWGWSDNGWDGDGPLMYFQTSGPQTLRIQRREDGISIDQIVLSSVQYLSKAPGAAKNDTTILTGSTTSPPEASGTDALQLTSSSAATLRDGAYADTNLSTATVLETRVGSSGYTRRIQTKFDTHNTIPAGSSIASATLTLTVAGGNAETRQLAAYRGAYSYDGWAVTWNARKSGLYWPTPGGDMSSLAARQAVTNVVGSKVVFDVTATVQKIVNGEYGGSRYARFLIADTGAASRDSYKQYYSDEAADGSLRPVLSVVLGTGTTTTTTTVKLRVLQWNLHHGVGTDGVYDIDRIATWMAKVNPDVVLLNEVEKNTWWGYEDQPARYEAMLEAKTGRNWYSHFSQEYGDWNANGKGHQILSVYPFDSVSHETITQSSGLNGAGAVSQTAITVNGRTITLILSHLDPYDGDMRLIQAKDVIRYAAGFAENRIIAGDMNAWPDQTSIAEFNKTYYDSWTVAANTGMATGISDITPFGATKNGRIDYIFYSKDAPNLVALSSWTPDTRNSSGHMPSDHRPVLTTFEVR